MAFIDEMKLRLKAGRGGDGVVRWLHEKGKEYSGAAGGNGGNGGNVYARGLRDIAALAQYRNKKEFAAERGVDGGNKKMYGRNGEDFYISVPVGSIITRLDENGEPLAGEAGEPVHVLKEGDEVLLLKGGRGGLGNMHFKASTNTSPQESTPGKPGDEGDFYIEVQLMVDAGLVGFPNAGKSSLLNAITNADAKIGSYAFTTLEPNLGDFYKFILADIPGLIEGAAEGRGLGHKFLRHIKRTKLVLHCISLENLKDPETGKPIKDGLKKAYQTIREELEVYGKELTEKPEVIILTKTDLVLANNAADAKSQKADKKILADLIAQAQKLNKGKGANAAGVLAVSVYDDASLKVFKDQLVKILRDVDAADSVPKNTPAPTPASRAIKAKATAKAKASGKKRSTVKKSKSKK